MWVLAELKCLQCAEVTELLGEMRLRGSSMLRQRCRRCGGQVFLEHYERRMPVISADEQPAARRGRRPKYSVV
jgi:hypothetical protein